MKRKIMISKPIWIDDSENSEEGGYYQALTFIERTKIKVKVWTKKPDNFNDGERGKPRHLLSEDGNYYWCIPNDRSFWPDEIR